MSYHVSIQRRPGHGRLHAGNTEELFRGQCLGLPIVGKRFLVVGYPGGAHPYVHTSTVLSVARIEEDQRLVALIVETRNSLYDVKISHEERGDVAQ